MGNAVKYIARADYKSNPIEDLEKARWYIEREIERRKKRINPELITEVHDELHSIDSQ